MIPLKGDLVTSLRADPFTHGPVVYVASDSTGIDVLDGAVVGWRPDVLVASITLVLSIDPDTPDVSMG